MGLALAGTRTPSTTPSTHLLLPHLRAPAAHASPLHHAQLLPRLLSLAKDNLRERTIFGLTERFHDSVTLINAQLIHYFPRTLGGVRLGATLALQ